LFLKVFEAKSATVHEEALMAVGAIASAVKGDFERYMPVFSPVLNLGLRNFQEHQVCAIAVAVVGDVCRALEKKVYPYCDEIITHLLNDLQNPLLNRNVKPPILACFGDIALAIGGDFEKYLVVVMTMLHHASTQPIPDNEDYELTEFMNSLREGILEAYTGIIQGLHGDGKANLVEPYLDNIIGFILTIANEPNKYENVVRAAVGVIGDLAHSLTFKVKTYLNEPIKQLIKECIRYPSESTKDVGKWAREVTKKL